MKNLQSETIVSLPTMESQVRPLAKLEPAQQVEAWTQAVAASPTGKPTAKIAEAAVQRVQSVK